jgi:hypothetical protein
MSNSMTVLAPSRSPRCEVILREELSRADRGAMFRLLSRYFAGVSFDVFERDLAEKEWVVLLRDENGVIDGFSTLMRMELEGATVFFSGDTIVARHRWGTYDLPRMWGRHVFSIAETLSMDVYWFLISSGFRTYRYLPLFFREFYPTVDGETPRDMKTLLDAMARQKFGEAYDAASGVVRLATPAPLRAGVSDPDARVDRDRHVRFFLEANPDHARGDELACIVRVARDNLTAAGLRMIR